MTQKQLWFDNTSTTGVEKILVLTLTYAIVVVNANDIYKRYINVCAVNINITCSHCIETPRFHSFTSSNLIYM